MYHVFWVHIWNESLNQSKDMDQFKDQFHVVNWEPATLWREVHNSSWLNNELHPTYIISYPDTFFILCLEKWSLLYM